MCSQVQRYTKFLLGAVCLIPQVITPFFALPIVYITRMIVILLAKLLRPDFDEILGGLTAVYYCDLLDKTPPRSTVVVTSVFQNKLTCDQFKKAVLRAWIEGNENKKVYKKFQQYPVSWLGFGFWKNAFHEFSIDKHVHSAFGNGAVVSDKELNQLVEEMMNGRFADHQSPWEFQIVENYSPGQGNYDDKMTSLQSVVICKFHHTLADGFSIISAMTRLFDNQLSNPFNFPVAKHSTEKKSIFHRLQYILMFPVYAFIEGCFLLSNNFISCPWKVPDGKKKWCQLIARMEEPIPLEKIKAIKEKFGVAFTSVLLSAVSAAIYSSLEIVKNDNKDEESVLCLNVLPIPFNRSEDDKLTNNLVGNILDIPKIHFATPLQRLRAVDRMLKSKQGSALAYLSQVLPFLCGLFALPICRLLSKNSIVPFALSNVPGLAHNFELNGNPVVDNEFQIGATPGVAGVTISALSHGQNIRLSIAVEEGLMSRAQAQQFLKYITNEIWILKEMADTF